MPNKGKCIICGQSVDLDNRHRITHHKPRGSNPSRSDCAGSGSVPLAAPKEAAKKPVEISAPKTKEDPPRAEPPGETQQEPNP